MELSESCACLRFGDDGQEPARNGHRRSLRKAVLDATFAYAIAVHCDVPLYAIF